jgi:hypothetical protein
MSAALVRRQAALAGIALLAALAALGLARSDEQTRGENVVVVPGGARWQEAAASVWSPASDRQETACGVEVTPETRGLTHPVLPCGVELLVSFEGKTAQAEVVDRGPHGGSAELELTEALARELGFSGTQRIRWRFAD